MSTIATTTFTATRSVEPGVEVIAFGDVHGRSRELAALFDHARDMPRMAPRRTCVMLGDVNDRGPDSLGAWALAEDALARTASDEVVDLMGNHEQMLCMAMGLPDGDLLTEAVIDEACAVWAGNGGDQVVAEMVRGRGADYGSVDVLLAEARERFGRRAARLRSHFRSGDAMFVHAGLNPRVPLEDMLAEPWVQFYPRMSEVRHWAWVREPFLNARPGARGHHGLFVVHGHSPRGGVDFVDDAEAVTERSRLNLDGGSFATGRVRMARIVGDAVEMSETRPA